jgi:hypothetical protein
VFVAIVVALLPSAGPAAAVSPSIVISQIYGGGGNSGATLKNDFIELFNRGTATVDVTGWAVQYAATTGLSWQKTDLSGPIAPGQYYLVREAPGAGGTVDLPPADASGGIMMSATAGKVALTNTSTLLAGTCIAGPGIIDFVGYGSTTNCYEGAGPTASLSNTTAALRGLAGCVDTDSNTADFVTGAPAPRNTASPTHSCGEAAPSVATTVPASGAGGVARDATVTITFSEPVEVTGGWFEISCASSGAHTAAVSGGPTAFSLDPEADFAFAESCTVIVFAAQVADQDADDPPDNMDADHAFSFTTEAPPLEIHDVQGAAHRSPFAGQTVSGVVGVVIAERSSSFYMQDPTPDADDATSDGILVFGSGLGGLVNVGDLVRVTGRVDEFRPGGDPENLTTTEITTPGLVVTVLSSGNPLPPTTLIGAGGRVPPMTVIEDDASGDVEASGVLFDPGEDGIDFWESLEGMRLEIADAVAVGPRNPFGEIPVVSASAAAPRTARGGVIIGPEDFNPERILLDDTLRSTPVVNVGDRFTTSVVGVLDYSFANFKLNITQALTRVDGGIQREVTRAPLEHEIVVGTYNVENLDPGDGAAFARHADLIVNHLRSPDLLAIEEIQDNDGATNSAVTDASVTWAMLIAAITAAGGPFYEYRQIDPVDDQDGGQPGGNIRVGFLFRTDRGLEFIDRPGGDSTTPVTVVDHPSGPRLSASPGRVAPGDASFTDTRKPLAGEFRMNGKHMIVIANHLSSKGDDQPLFGRFQPPERVSEEARHPQAQALNDFVNEILEVDSQANVIVLGDINDFDFSETVEILEGGVLTTLMRTLPPAERYSYVFEGNSQVLDQILVSHNLLDAFEIEYDPVHVNSEFADQASDHDPQVARLDLRGRPTPKTK